MQFPAFTRNPLVPAAAVFLGGVTFGTCENPPALPLLLLAVTALPAWLLAEFLGQKRCAHWFLAFILFSTGGALCSLNQHYVEPTHVAGLTREQPTLIALRAEVLVPPTVEDAHANRYWLARARQVLTDGGWQPASGDFQIQWHSAPGAIELQPQMSVELYGWLERPPVALNPGAMNPRRQLAADRIFAQLRIPRASGVILLDDSQSTKLNPLTRVRLFLRAKLLQHLLPQNVPAAYTLTALLLGYRDPDNQDVSQSFADAGVAHLLAISGSHIALFTLLVWSILRYFPMRPMARELVMAAVIGGYVLATPCNPPILRAAIALVLLILARALGRPRQFLNMLAAAAITVVILRPSDLTDAGFQLTFITTAALILFSPRVHAALFAGWLARQNLIAELSRRRGDRLRLGASKLIAGILVANLIGSVTAAPLVAWHFGQFNPWAPLAGLLALPMVALAMVMVILQLLAALIAGPLAAALSPLTAFTGQALIRLIGALAHLPLATLALRRPPVWLLLCAYALFLLWYKRREIRLSRAQVLNASLALFASAAAWFSLTTPVGGTELTILSTGTSGQGSCILLRTPSGELWTINAGAPPQTSLLSSALRPAMRLAGSRHLDGQIVSSLDIAHAGAAAEVLATYQPPRTFIPATAWSTRDQTLAGQQLSQAAPPTRFVPLSSDQALNLATDCRLSILWPPPNPPIRQSDFVLLLTCSHHNILIANPAASDALAMVVLGHPNLHCDAILFTGPEPVAPDAPARLIIQPLTPATIIWSSRTTALPPLTPHTDLNAADGAITLRAGGTSFAIRRTSLD